MSNISFTAHGRCARATYCEPITTGSVGLSVSFAFDAAWSGLQKTAIFRGSGMAVDLVLSGDAATVPPEVLTIPGGDLRIGVWGADPDENVIIPTVWATVGEIVPGSAPSGIDPQPPTPSWAAQVQEIAQDALDTANSVREDADAGAFDGATYTPAVSADGDLSWTNDKGKPNPPTVNIKGPEGQPGQTGATPDISIGTVETLPPGGPATATITGTAENPVLSFGIPQGQQGDPGEVTQAEFDALADEVTQQKSAIDDLTALVDRKAGMLVDTASGAIASFVPDASVENLLGVTVDIEPVQDLHGYDSPWPGGGGKNLLPYPYVTTGSTWNGMSLAEVNGKVSIKGTQNGVDAYIFAKDVPLKSGVTYTISPNFIYAAGSRSIALTVYDAKNSVLVANTSSSNATFTADADRAVSIYLNPSRSAQGLSFDFSVQPQMEVGSTATAWSSYSNICPISGWDAVSIWNKPTHDTSLPPTVTIQIGQTVYDAKLTIAEDRSVNALIDRARVTLDGTQTGLQENWAARPGISGWLYPYNLTNNAITQSDYALPAGLSCDVLPTISYSDAFAGTKIGIGLVTANNRWGLCVRYPSENYRTLADINALLSENPMTVVYKLATPITIQLDPVTISTIPQQTNNVWADAGDVAVEFAADLKAYIDSKIAALAAQIVNS